MQETLFEPSEEDLYQRAIRQPLERKIARAIHLLRTYEQSALNLSDEGYYLCFSGGKDSVVLAELAKMAGVAHTLDYSVTTIDPPELVRFIKRHYPHCRWHREQKKPLPLRMADSSLGPPTRLKRWCCLEYKEIGGDGLVKATGVRAPESARRKGLWREVNANKNGGTIVCPIVYWTDADVWTFIKQRNIAYCELYDQGFHRLGCIGCPFGGANGRKRDFAKWPRYERLWRLGFERYWNRWRGVPKRDGSPRYIEQFNTVEEFWNWWVSDESMDYDKPDCQLYLW